MRQLEGDNSVGVRSEQILGGVFLPVSESQERAKNVGKECKVKKRLWVKKYPLKTVALAVKM